MPLQTSGPGAPSGDPRREKAFRKIALSATILQAELASFRESRSVSAEKRGFTADRPYSDPDKAARRLMQHAHAFEPLQEGRIYIEKLNGPFLFGDKGTPAEYAAGLDRAISLGWLEIHDSGTFVKLTQSGADLFA